MPERPIEDLLRLLPDEVEPEADFADRLRRRLEHDLAESSELPRHSRDASLPPRYREITMLQKRDTSIPPARRWLLAAAAAVLVVVAGVIVVANRVDESSPADDPSPTLPPVPATTTPALTTRQTVAVEAATDYFRAFGRGDGAAVVGVSDPVVSNGSMESALAQWWSGAAATGNATPEWPSEPCRPVGTDTGGPVLVECPLVVTDPVAVALGADRLLWSVEVDDDGTVRRRAEPLTLAGGTYSSVWNAHGDYLSAHRPKEYAVECDPSSTEVGQVWVQGGLALDRACAELVRAAAPDTAAWIAAGRPDPRDAPPSDEVTSAPAAEIPLTAGALEGYWTNVGGRTSGWTALLVDFRPDGTFTIGNTGSLEEGAFTGGTYEIEEDRIVLRAADGECGGETFVWSVTRFVDGMLDVDVIPNGGCAPDAGWTWVRVSPAGPAALALEPGSSPTASSDAPSSITDVRGIWLRLGTSQVLAVETDGSYLLTTRGDTVSPDDTGQLRVDTPGTLAFESEGSGDCVAGETWTWDGVSVSADLIREGNPRGTTMRMGSGDLCGSTGEPAVWRLLSPDRVDP